VADVRGFGETMSARRISDPHLDYFDPRDGMDADFTFASFFLGRPLLGMRVRDARYVVSFMRARSDVDSAHITIVGRHWAGVVALFTAASEPAVSSVVVEGTPVSFGSIAAAELYNQPVSLMLPGALRDFDLTDIFSALAPRPLLVINPQDAMTRKLEREDARQTVESIQQAYHKAEADRVFEEEVVALEPDTQNTIVKWVARH